MNFHDSPEEASFRHEVRAFLAAHCAPKQEQQGSLSLFGSQESPQMIADAKAWQHTKAVNRWAAMTWPRKYGGRGGSMLEQIIFAHEEAQFQTAPNLFMIGIGWAGPTIQVHGRPEQKNKWLAPLLSGKEIWCQLFSEPGAGSDLAGLRTSAVRSGDEWIINGQKVWTSGAHYADWGILITRTDANVPKHRGLTYFVLDMKSPGVEIRPIKQITGGANFNEVFLTEVRIPDANRLDQVGNGWSVALTTLMNERMSISSSLGMMGGAGLSQHMLRLLETSFSHGRAAIEDSALRQQVAQFHAQLRGLELTINRVISALGKNNLPGPEASTAKLVMGILLQDIANYCISLQGPLGMATDAEGYANGMFPDLYLGIPAARIGGGTDEVLRNIIGERMLGLPPEIRIDKGVPFSELSQTSIRAAS